MKEIKAAQKQLDRALANLDLAANCLEEAGLTAQAQNSDGAGRPLRACVIRWQRCESVKALLRPPPLQSLIACAILTP